VLIGQVERLGVDWRRNYPILSGTEGEAADSLLERIIALDRSLTLLLDAELALTNSAVFRHGRTLDQLAYNPLPAVIVIYRQHLKAAPRPLNLRPFGGAGE
jgi:hypothetical protein